LSETIGSAVSEHVLHRLQAAEVTRTGSDAQTGEAISHTPGTTEPAPMNACPAVAFILQPAAGDGILPETPTAVPCRYGRSGETAMHATILALTATALVVAPLPVAAQDAAADSPPQNAHGAIAFGQTADGEAVAYGFAWNYDAKDEAIHAALTACRAGGGTTCEEVAWFANGCGALALDRFGYYGGTSAMSQEQAEARAVRSCEAAGGSGCAVVGSQCAGPGGQAGTWSGSERVLAAPAPDATDPAAAGPETERRAPATEAREEALPREMRILVQKGLAVLGFDPGPVDGLFGRKTRAAIWDWQAAKELDATGYLTVPEAEALAAVGMESGETPDMEVREPAGQVAASAAAESETGSDAVQPRVIRTPTCGEDDMPEGCWRELTSPANCEMYLIPYFSSSRTVTLTWSGECNYEMIPGVADGQGTLEWEGGSETGKLVGGIQQGHWVYVFRHSDGLETHEGPYVDGKRHGHWVWRYPGDDSWEGPYVDGEWHGRWVRRKPDGTVRWESEYRYGEKVR